MSLPPTPKTTKESGLSPAAKAILFLLAAVLVAGEIITADAVWDTASTWL